MTSDESTSRVSGCPVAHGYSPLETSTLREPFPVLNRLRDEGPVFYLPEYDYYIITRYDDVERVLLDRETWSAANASSPMKPPCPAAQAILAADFHRVPTLNNADPPRHGPMRKAVLTVMSPRRLNALEPTLRAYAESLVKGLMDEPVVDLVDRLAFPFPGYAAFSLLGFPHEDTNLLKEWSHKRMLITYGSPDEAEEVESAKIVVQFWKYCERHVASRRAQRDDDITSDLLDLADAKPDQLNDFDIVNMVYSMALAGHETTSHTIANGMRALLTDRSQWQRLIDEPQWIPNTAEEILRYDGPLLHHRRIAKVDTVVGGVPIPAGAKVMMCFASADRDPSQFSDPDHFDVTRENAELHLQFGKGPHFCLGAALGRLEVRIVLELLTTLTPNVALLPDQTFEYSPKVTGRVLEALMVCPNVASRDS